MPPIFIQWKNWGVGEVNVKHDFVARTEQFQQLVKDISMQIAAANPLYVKDDDVPESVLAKEREIYRAQFSNSESLKKS